MAKKGSQEVSGLTKAFEDGRKLTQLTCHLELLSSEREAELCTFKGLPSVGDNSVQVNA